MVVEENVSGFKKKETHSHKYCNTSEFHILFFLSRYKHLISIFVAKELQFPSQLPLLQNLQVQYSLIAHNGLRNPGYACQRELILRDLRVKMSFRNLRTLKLLFTLYSQNLQFEISFQIHTFGSCFSYQLAFEVRHQTVVLLHFPGEKNTKV